MDPIWFFVQSSCTTDEWMSKAHTAKYMVSVVSRIHCVNMDGMQMSKLAMLLLVVPKKVFHKESPTPPKLQHSKSSVPSVSKGVLDRIRHGTFCMPFHWSPTQNQILETIVRTYAALRILGQLEYNRESDVILRRTWLKWPVTNQMTKKRQKINKQD